MRKFMFMLAFVLTAFFAMQITMMGHSLALADAVTASPVPTGVATLAFSDWITEIFSLTKTWGTLGNYGAILAVLKILMDATKTDFLGNLYDKLTVGSQIAVMAGLSAATVGVGILATGGNLAAAAVAVIQSSAGAMIVHWIVGLIYKPATPSA